MLRLRPFKAAGSADSEEQRRVNETGGAFNGAAVASSNATRHPVHLGITRTTRIANSDSTILGGTGQLRITGAFGRASDLHRSNSTLSCESLNLVAAGGSADVGQEQTGTPETDVGNKAPDPETAADGATPALPPPAAVKQMPPSPVTSEADTTTWPATAAHVQRRLRASFCGSPDAGAPGTTAPSASPGG